MSAPSEHERFAELAAGHALHALEPAEEQLFAAHLVACSACQQELSEHTETLGHLAYAADPFDLPAGILAGLRSEIGAATLRSVPPTTFAPTSSHAASSNAATAGAAKLPAPVSLDAVRDRRRRVLAGRNGLGLAAAVALVLSLGVWNINLHRAKSQEDVRAGQLAAAVATLEHGAKQRVEMTDQLGHPVAVAVVRADNTVSLVVDGLAPNNRRTSTYVLWQKGDYGVVRAVGTFDVGPGVNVIANLPLASDVVGLQEFAVTQEAGRHAPPGTTKPPVAEGLAT